MNAFSMTPCHHCVQILVVPNSVSSIYRELRANV